MAEEAGDSRLAVGIDIGGTGIKGGIVDLEHGAVQHEPVKIATPRPATPQAIAAAVSHIVQDLGYGPGVSPADTALPLGVAFPGIVRSGVCLSAANVDRAWIGVDAPALFAQLLGRRPSVIKDADAAGLAEVVYGAGSAAAGTVVVITLGTGIGSALVFDGKLIPNTELGHLELDGSDAETKASALARERDGLSWEDYGRVLNRYLSHLEFLFSPDLFIVGGGISVRADEFLPGLSLRSPVVAAQLRNDAGIVGAARHAAASVGDHVLPASGSSSIPGIERKALRPEWRSRAATSAGLLSTGPWPQERTRS